MNVAAERFARHGLIPGWQQPALSDASVVIVGVGALGNVVAQNLALSGVGRLILCDPDVVAASNLSRTPLFRERDVGRTKVDAAAQALKNLSPGLVVEARHAEHVSGVGLAELRDATLVIGCLDSQISRLGLAGRCGLVRARSIDAATSAWGGEVRCYLEPDQGCFGCGLTVAERGVVDQPWSCGDIRPGVEMGASIAVSGLVASLAAICALRALMGLPVASQTLSVDGERGVVNVVHHQRDPECPLHEPLALEGSRRVVLGPDSTVGELRAALGEGTFVELWRPFTERVECSHCGWFEARPNPVVTTCPRCGARTRARTTLGLQQVPANLTLGEVGVAPREILPVRSPSGFSHVELG